MQSQLFFWAELSRTSWSKLMNSLHTRPFDKLSGIHPALPSTESLLGYGRCLANRIEAQFKLSGLAFQAVASPHLLAHARPHEPVRASTTLPVKKISV